MSKQLRKNIKDLCKSCNVKVDTMFMDNRMIYFESLEKHLQANAHVIK